MDITHVTLPQWLTTLIVFCVGGLAWRGLQRLFDMVCDKFEEKKRRVGSRETDDHKGIRNNDWIKGLIEAMNANAEINQKVMVALTTLSGKQDSTLQAFQLTQIQMNENNQRIEEVHGIVNRIDIAVNEHVGRHFEIGDATAG